MPDRQWKQEEREAARLLGGTRYPANSGGRVDEIPPAPFGSGVSTPAHAPIQNGTDVVIPRAPKVILSPTPLRECPLRSH